MASLYDLVPQITLFAQNCPDPIAIQYGRDASRRFARDTKLWDVSLGSTSVSPPTPGPGGLVPPLRVAVPSVDTEGEPDADGDFVVPTDGVVYAITRVTLDGMDAEDVPHNALRRLRQAAEYDKGQGLLVLDPGFVTHSGTLEVRAALQPTLTANTIPDTFLEWDIALRSLAIHLILNIPGRDWSDSQNARIYYRQYQDQVAMANNRRSRHETDLPLRTGHNIFV